MFATKRMRMNEFLFVFHIFQFTLLKPILQTTSNSKLLLLGVTVLILSASFINNRLRIHTNWLIYFVFTSSIVLIDILFRYNGFTINGIYDYFVFCIITPFLFSYLSDYKQMLKIFSLVSLFVLMEYIVDPLNHYAFSGDYMSFGQILTPAYFGLLLGRKMNNMAWILPFEFICLLEIVFFANKGSILGAFVMLFMVKFVFDIKRNYWMIKYTAPSMLILTLCLNLKSILEYIIDVFSQHGYFSYALWSIHQALNGDILSGLSGRDQIWNTAIEMYWKRPILGYGMEYFENETGGYTHNLVLDLLIQYGMIGLLIVVLLLSMSIRQIVKQESYEKLTGILILCLWFPKLFFSNTFFKEPAFWIMLYYGVSKLQSSTQIRNSSSKKGSITVNESIN